MAIGETFLGAVLQVVLDRLASKQVINFFKSSKINQALVKKLTDLMRVAGKLLVDAEQKQNSDDDVKSWLDDLKHLFYRAEEIADQIATEARRSPMDLSPEPKSLGSKVWDLISANRSSSSFASAVNSQISEVVNQLHDMVSLSVALNLKEGSASVNTTSRRETTSYLHLDDKVFGRDQEKKELLKFLFSEEAETNRIGVVAIVGMGGMGKTTLAGLIYNYQSLEAFEMKAWVYVSDQFDISLVIKSILQSITGQPYSGSLELEFLHHELIEKLRGKRFFLVLDDVWNENYEDWKSLLAPLKVGAHGSKIIVTTRNEEVASILRTVPVIRLKPLSDEDGWLLFSKHAFEVGNLSSDPYIESYGRKIVDKCQGLALAIKTLGGLLRSKEDIHEWKKVLESSLWDLPNTKGNVAPALRLSYYHLPSHLKRCFSYCAIFPKGYKFDKKMLVRLWMAEGFVKSSGVRSKEDIGEDYLNKLLSCSFFDRSGNRIVMHDLMHDLAEAVSGDFFSRLDDEDQALSISEKARYFSFASFSFVGLSRFEGLHEAKYLRTFVPYERWFPINRHMNSRILVAMIPQFYCLRVLSVSGYRFIELPESIGNLKQLRYLDVSGTIIKELPESVSKLCHLQSLLMSRCNAIERLPTDMSKLVSLRYLDVSGTRIKELPESVSTLCNLQSLVLSHCNNLEQLPVDTSRLMSLRHLDISDTTSLKQMPNHMSKLKYLQTFSGFVVGKHCGRGIEELRDLRHIRGKIALRRLQNISSPEVALDANLSCKEHIGELAFEYDDSGDYGSKIIEAVLENLKPHPNLEKLTIRRYPGTQFPNWLDTQCSMYKNIVNLTLEGCKNCYRLPALGQLPSLKYLEIVGMENIEVIGSDFYGYDSGLDNLFPVLQKLVIRDMEYWKEWLGHDMEDRIPFPCLEEVHIVNCPELRGDLPVNVLSAKVLYIKGCESLESSLLQQPSVEGSQVSASHDRALGSSFHLASITELKLKGLKEFVSLPPELDMLSCLKTLKLQDYENLKSIENIRLPSNLQSLEISKCKVVESLPKEMDVLDNLRRFNASEFPRLKSAPEDTLPTSLQSLGVNSGESWELSLPIERMLYYSALKFLSNYNMGDLGTFYLPTGVDFMNLKMTNFIKSGDSWTRVRKQKQRRSLFIFELENVSTEADAQAYNLQSEEYLEELVLEWSATSDDLEKARTVLTALKPHKTLTRLTINNYPGTSFPQWVADSAFYCLRTLQLNNCSNCISLPSLGELPSLVYLSLKNFNSLQIVGPEFFEEIASQSTPFGTLKILHFEDLPQWHTWDVCEGRAFPNLQELSFIKCSQLVGKLPAELLSLRKLEILDCEQLNISLPQLPQLTTLRLQNCELVDLAILANLSSLTSLDVSFEGENNAFVPKLEKLTSLSYLRIAGHHNFCNCEELQFPSTLDTLFISQPVDILTSPLSSFYDSVELLPSLHVLRCMPSSLTSLSIGGFKDLKLPKHSCMSLQYLSIHDCYLAEPSQFPLGNFLMLEYLEIKNCFHLELFDITSSTGHGICLQSLNELSIDNCPDLLTFPRKGFAAPNLRTLSITNCKNLLSLPEEMDTCMASLLSLSLENCPDLHSFPNGGLPLCLQTLRITYCQQLTSNWKQWKLEQLVSLTRLEMQGCKEVECFPPQGWLPASLTTLVIAHFPDLVFLIGEALQDTSLQELKIMYCQKLLSLPEEGLPPSLKYLGMYFCPLLKKQCQRDEGEDWPKISHLPRVIIDFQEI